MQVPHKIHLLSSM